MIKKSFTKRQWMNRKQFSIMRWVSGRRQGPDCLRAFLFRCIDFAYQGFNTAGYQGYFIDALY